MKLTLRLDSDNDAFAVDGESEVARLLRKTADAIEEGHSSGLLHRSGHLIWLAREVGPGRMAIVPKPCPQEFRDDVVRVARERESGG
ncbi:hypothetical protein ACFOJ6_24530 [Gordonia humi]|uniref:hypothetical protein n=1 Tax=Gordonia humi TaxID=686429 RepID=UPI00360BE380